MTDPIDAAAKKLPALFWFRAFMGISAVVTPMTVAYGVLWMQANYVTAETDRAAWSKQVTINEKLAQQAEDLRRSDAVQEATIKQHDAALRDIKQDIRDQRAILRLPVPHPNQE